jgi:hypothetical protein
MADAAQIVARLRAHGANIVMDGGGLRIVNGRKLPPGSREYVLQHRDAIAEFLAAEHDAVEERAAIVEFEAGAPREWAEEFARFCIQRRPAGLSDAQWAQFLDVAGQFIDMAPQVAA